ncbi:MAG: CoA-binding protein [Chloroflexi bacterium]|nr:MAG: CoA-binding protein [Chloroflexota bacterium]
MSVVIADESVMRQLLQSARTIAVVGHSDKPHRTSYQIAQYLRRQGYQVYPVNPTVQTIDGETAYPSVQAIPEQVDIVNVFRRSEFLMDVVEDAIAAGARAVWTQLGVVDEAAALKATEAGLTVVMNRCIKVEHMRLL